VNFTILQKKNLIALIISTIITIVAVLSYFIPVVEEIAGYFLTFLLGCAAFVFLFCVVRITIAGDDNHWF